MQPSHESLTQSWKAEMWIFIIYENWMNIVFSKPKRIAFAAVVPLWLNAFLIEFLADWTVSVDKEFDNVTVTVSMNITALIFKKVANTQPRNDVVIVIFICYF